MVKCGFRTPKLSQNNNTCSGVIPVHPTQKNSWKPSLTGKSCQLCSGTRRVCFWLISQSLKQPLHNKSIVKHFLNCAVSFTTNRNDEIGIVLLPITHVHTWLPAQLKQFKHSDERFLIIRHILLTSHPVTTMSSYTSRTGWNPRRWNFMQKVWKTLLYDTKSVWNEMVTT